MSENEKKGGAGKFFLGAVLGGIAGAIAGRFITAKAEEMGEGHECKCGKCQTEEEETPVKKTAEKKPSEKK